MADFFEEVDSLGIVENHIQEVLGLEDSKGQILLRRYREIRQELRDRLDRLPGDTFSSQQLRGTLTQVEAAIDAMTVSLQTGMKTVALDAALMGVDHQLKELKKFDQVFLGAVTPININAQLVAEDTKNFLLNRYDSSLNAYGQDLINQVTSQLTTEALAGSPLGAITRRLGQFFLGEEWKLLRIARTELHNVYNIGKMNGMIEVRDSVLDDLKKTLIHPMDARTGMDSKYVAKLDLIVPLDQPFMYTWKGKKRIYMAPPDRPNDRSILVPYRQVWDK